jgi:hypothetical protein
MDCFSASFRNRDIECFDLLFNGFSENDLSSIARVCKAWNQTIILLTNCRENCRWEHFFSKIFSCVSRGAWEGGFATLRTIFIGHDDLQVAPQTLREIKLLALRRLVLLSVHCEKLDVSTTVVLKNKFQNSQFCQFFQKTVAFTHDNKQKYPIRYQEKFHLLNADVCANSAERELVISDIFDLYIEQWRSDLTTTTKEIKEIAGLVYKQDFLHALDSYFYKKSIALMEMGKFNCARELFSLIKERHLFFDKFAQTSLDLFTENKLSFLDCQANMEMSTKQKTFGKSLYSLMCLLVNDSRFIEAESLAGNNLELKIKLALLYIDNNLYDKAYCLADCQKDCSYKREIYRACLRHNLALLRDSFSQGHHSKTAFLLNQTSTCIKNATLNKDALTLEYWHLLNEMGILLPLNCIDCNLLESSASLQLFMQAKVDWDSSKNKNALRLAADAWNQDSNQLYQFISSTRNIKDEGYKSILFDVVIESLSNPAYTDIDFWDWPLDESTKTLLIAKATIKLFNAGHIIQAWESANRIVQDQRRNELFTSLVASMQNLKTTDILLKLARSRSSSERRDIYLSYLKKEGVQPVIREENYSTYRSSSHRSLRSSTSSDTD